MTDQLPKRDGVLAGMRVLSFCHYLQGPACTQYLTDMGADVVKIEPGKGGFERHWAGADRVKIDGVSAFYIVANRGSRSLALDLKHPDSRAVIHALIARSHVVVENFRPGVLDRLGYGYEQVKALKPDIIYASASGFGSDGPYKDRPGQDLLIQSMSGLVHATGVPSHAPTPAGCAIADQHGGALLALGIAGAYAKLLAGGGGTRVETSLLAAGIDLQGEAITTYFAAGRGPKVFERDTHLGTWFHSSPYGVYRLACGQHVALSMNEPAKLARALDSQAIAALADINAYEERDRLAAAVAEALAGKRFDAIVAPFDREGIWYARVDDYEALRRNPQVVHNRLLSEIPAGEAKAVVVSHPLRYDGEGRASGEFAAAPGAHTREVLAELGFAQSAIDGLLGSGAAHAPAGRS
ncbi:MAG: CoA transferase [Alphaproteobacteria bacterium]|nr:CoA transferase [Alphaproteobacteria bacterium]